MTDVLFITPNIHGNVQEEPVGTLLLATILRNAGISADILQFSNFGELAKFNRFVDTAVKQICREKPKIVSFYTRCDTYHITLTIARRIKEKHPKIWIVFGGPQSDITAIDTVREIDWVDFVCCGEGENTVLPLFSSLLAGTPDLRVDGLVYRADGEVVSNPRPQLIADLDTLPEIDYSLIRYTNALYTKSAGLFPLDVGRGCPFGCTYCSTKTFWGRKYRLKTPARIVQELENVHRVFGIDQFAFEHDMFTMKRTQVLETCRLMKQLDFPVTWRCSARMDCLDKELIDAMADAGLESIFVGIETGSPRMQKLINKNLKLDGVLEMLEYISSKNVKTMSSFIYGFPEETPEDVAQTMAMIAKIMRIPGAEVQTHLCTFLPGTELSARYLCDMVPAQGYSDIVGAQALPDCQELIEDHPKLFNHLLEYHTPLRGELYHFSTFIKMWSMMPQVYLYLSEKYGEAHLMDMYYDFVRSNEVVLEQTKKMETAVRIGSVMQNDLFAKRFENDDNYDIISDIYRLKNAVMSDKVKKGGTVTDVYCISPKELRKLRLQDMIRSTTVLSCIGMPDGSVRIRIHNKN